MKLYDGFSWFLWAFLLCSQGIFDMDDEEDINAIVRKVLSKGERKFANKYCNDMLRCNVLSWEITINRNLRKVTRL